MRQVFILLFPFFLISCNVYSYLTKPKQEIQKELSIEDLYPKEPGMVIIPAGEFEMGSDRLKNTKPVHKIYLEPFYIDKTEVTVADFKYFAKATKRKMPEQPIWNKDNHPVVNVTWDDANAYAKWAGKRLPTEAEWEYVARGGKFQYDYVYQNSGFYGNNYENIADESMRREKFHFPVVDGYDDGYVYTSPVGVFPPNVFGINDLNGNVMEWCSDWYSETFEITQTKNPQGPEEGYYKVIRGASWNRSGTYMLATFRTFYNKKVRFEFLGFRCAKDAVLPVTVDDSRAFTKK